MSRVFFFIGEGLRALRRSAAPSVAAIVTVAVTMLLLGVLIPVLQATGGKTEEVRDQVGLRIFLTVDATQQDIPGVGGRIAVFIDACTGWQACFVMGRQGHVYPHERRVGEDA